MVKTNFSKYILLVLLNCCSVCVWSQVDFQNWTNYIPAQPINEFPLISDYVFSKFYNESMKNGSLNCQDYVDDSTECNWSHQQTIRIEGDEPCSFQCWYDPSKIHPGPVRLSVHLKSPPGHIFVSAEQRNEITSWTIPRIFKGGNISRPYTSVESVLCPPKETKNETIRFRISTSDSKAATVNISLIRATYLIALKEEVRITNSPVSPWVKLYRWTDKSEDSVLITVETVGKKGGSVCAFLSLQNAECPFYTEQENLRSHGHYQSFQSRGGMIAKREDFPAGIHIVVLPMPNDYLCTGQEFTGNLAVRRKSVRLAVLPHVTIGEKWTIFTVGGALITVLFTLCGCIFMKLMQRSFKSSENFEESSDQTAANFVKVTRGLFSTLFRQNSPEDEASQNLVSEELRDEQISSIEQSSGEIQNGRHEGALTLPSIMSADQREPETYDAVNNEPLEIVEYHRRNAQLIEHDRMNPRLMQVTESFNPRYVLWQKMFAVFQQDSPDSQISQVGFQNSFFVIAFFTAMPLAEMLESSLSVFGQAGSEDECFFNNRCIVSFGSIPDFARVFSNIGYILASGIFLLILRKHKALSNNGSHGVFHNYGLLFALTWGIGLQGIMSSLYHICPNRVTIRADLMFMYILSIVVNVYIYGLRHGDVGGHVLPTVGMVGVTLAMGESKEYVPDWLFWVGVAAVHSGISISTAVTMIKNGTWSFSPQKVVSNWRLLKNLNMANGAEGEHTKLPTMIRAFLGLGANLALIILGISFDMNAYKYILLVCLANMGLYVGHYLITKKACGERGSLHSWICFALSAIAWIVALVFFFAPNTDSEGSPATSNALNNECILLEIFDAHDIWHLASSFGLFFSFCGILTLDDDLMDVPSEKIDVF